jgi:hypothetical protein
VGLRDVIERHHHDTEEEHGGDGADPVPVHRKNAVLICGPRPSHQLERSQICGDKAEAGDPGRHLPPGEEELLAGVGRSLSVEPDEDHQDEVEQQDENIGRREMREPMRHQRKNHAERNDVQGQDAVSMLRDFPERTTFT